jgi:PAS domain S-box-containing protein
VEVLLRFPTGIYSRGRDVNVAQPLVQVSLVGEAIDAGPVLVLVADEEMRYVAVNQYACDVLGYARNELLGLRVTDVALAPDTADRYARFLEKPDEGGTATLLRKDGKHVTIEYRARKTTVAGMELYVSVCLPLDAGS